MDHKTTKVLLLDEDPNLRGILSDILKVKGFETVPVETGAAALAQIEQQHIDVALIDLTLEDISGLEVLRDIKTRSPETECILLTGHASQATVIEAVNLGAYSCFQKPYEVDQLLVAIRRAVEKHLAGLALQESEARFRSLIENSSDLICILNPDATLNYASPSIKRLLGYSLDEVVAGTSLQDHIHPDDVPVFTEAFRQCIQASDSSPVSIQLRLLHKDGTWRTLDGTGSNQLELPAIKGIIVNVRDITERKQAEEEIRRMVERWSIIYHAGEEIGASLDLEQVFAAVHRAVEQVMPCEDFVISLYDEIQNKMGGNYILEKNKRVMPNPYQADHGLGGFILHSGQPLTLNSPEQINTSGIKFEPYGSGPITASVVAVPLQLKGKTIGIISAQSYLSDVYTAEDQELLEMLASHAAIAIDNARLFEQAQQEIAVRKQAEEKIKESEVRYRTLFEDSPISLWEEDFSAVKHQLDTLRKRGVKDFRAYLKSHPQVVAECANLVQVVDVNKATLELYRAGSKGELLRNLSLVFCDESYAQFREELIYIAEGKTQFNWEGVNQTLDGRRLDINLNFAVAPEHEGDLSKVIISIVDVTERFKAEKALRETKKNYRSLFENVPDGVYRSTLDGKFLSVNPALVKILGYSSAEELLKVDIARDTFIHPEARQSWANALLQKGELHYAETTMRRKDGQQIIVLENTQVILNAQGKAIYFEGTLTDITERKQAEEALRRSESSLQAILQSAADGILAVGSENEVLYANKRFAEMWRIPPAVMASKEDSVLLQHVLDQLSDPQSFLKKVQELYKSDDESFDTLTFKDGRVFERLSHPLMQGVKVRGRVWSFRDITSRKQSEEAIRQAEARYRSIVEQVPAIFYTEALDHRVIFVSPKIETILGYTPEEWMSEPDFWKSIVLPDDLKGVLAEDESTNQTGKPFLTEYRVFKKDGQMVWLRDQASLVKDGGKPIFWQGVMYDISAEKESEVALRTSEEGYRMLAENMSDTVWLMDMSLRTTYISPSVTRLRGFTLDEINSIPLDRQMPTDSLQHALQLFAETLSPENLAQPGESVSRTIELEFYKKDGTMFWSETTFTLIRDTRGQPFAIMGSGRDISERKQVEEALQKSERYFRFLIENNTDAVILMDPRGMILYESPAYARMMGRVTGQRLGQSGFEYIHAEDQGTVAQMLNELVQHPGEIRNFTFRNRHKDGSWRWIEATATNLLGESAVDGLVINMHDITERKQVEEEIRRRVAELEVLYENGLSNSVLLEPRKIAQKMIKVLSQKLDWHHATIRLYHPETGRTELLALNEPGLDPDQIQAEIDRLNKIFASPNMGLSGWVIRHGKTIRSGDVQADKRYFSAFPDIRSGLYVPLMIGERAIGSITVESREANRFSEDDERLLQTLAAQSAIAFENARLYQDAVSAAKRKAALHQGSLEIVRAGQEIEALCIAIHHAAQQVMPADAFTVSLLTEDGREVEAPYLFDRGIRHPNTRLPVTAGITGRVIKSKKPLRLKDVQKTRGVKPIMVGEMEPTRSILSVPLLAQDKIIGVLSAQSREPDVYSVEDQIFMETLASEAAVAFENARLFEEIRRRLAELESLSQVSVFLTSAIGLQPLLENILASARNAIPAAEKGTILLTEPDGALRLHAMSGYADSRLIDLVVPDQKGYVSRVAREQIPIKIDDAHAEYEIPQNGTIEEIDAVQSGIAAPLIVKGKMIGVISLDNTSRKTAFTGSDLRLLVTFASSAAVAIENVRLFSETQQRLHRLSALHSIDAVIGASVDMHVTLNIVLENVMSELKADAAAVLLFNPLTRMLEYAAGRGFRVHSIEGLRLRLGEGLAGQSALQRRAINIADLQQANELEQVMEHPISGSTSLPLQYLEEENFVAYHAIPLIAKGQIQGVLEIFRRTPMQVDQDWMNFFEMLAGQTAIAIDNGRLFENLQHTNLELTLAYDATIQGWSQALELRDEETEGHTRRVTDLTLRLIQALGVEEVEIEHARRGSLLHDIGKIAVPDSILLKCGPLDEHEWNVMRQHPQFAYNLLYPIVYLRPALHIPYCHHEKWDGSGYPRGLKGEEIPMVARIFTIVDVYDALISNRPYRLAWTPENALEYIREQSGKHFDPRVVKAFLALMAGEK